MKLNVTAELVDDAGTRTVIKGRIERHREDVAGDSEASFFAEWQFDQGDGDAVMFTSTVDNLDISLLNAPAIVAEALNGIDPSMFSRTGDYQPRELPTWLELMRGRKRRNTLE